MIESNPTYMPLGIANKYWLKKHQISQFEADHNLWLKLRNMEEYKVNPKFNMFVKYLEKHLYDETWENES
jgi:hypothetical protein